jgi:hypothetical protein
MALSFEGLMLKKKPVFHRIDQNTGSEATEKKNPIQAGSGDMIWHIFYNLGYFSEEIKCFLLSQHRRTSFRKHPAFVPCGHGIRSLCDGH